MAGEQTLSQEIAAMLQGLGSPTEKQDNPTEFLQIVGEFEDAVTGFMQKWADYGKKVPQGDIVATTYNEVSPTMTQVLDKIATMADQLGT